MRLAARRIALIAAACAVLLCAAPLAAAHTDPFQANHPHPAKTEDGSSNAGVAIAAVVLMIATAGALIGLKRTGRT